MSIRISALLLSLVISACVGMPRSGHMEVSFSEIESLPIDSASKLAKEKLGEPTSREEELINGKAYEAWIFESSTVEMRARLTVDKKKNLVVEKVFYPSSSEQGLAKETFNGLSSKGFHLEPMNARCHWVLHGGGSFLADRDKHLLVRLQKDGGRIQLFLWANDDLFTKRIAQLTMPCQNFEK